MRRSAGLVFALGLVAGCGSTTHELPPADELVPITQRAIAAIAIDHLGDDTSSRRATYTDNRSPAGMLGADLRYRASPGEDGDLVRVALLPGPADHLTGCPDWYDGCEPLDVDAPGAYTLRWQVEVPEEDPGVVMVVRELEGELAYVYQSGQKITGDPRDLDLHVSVDEMVEVAEDPWLRLETSPEAIEAGEELDDWEGGEPETAEAPARGPADLTDRATAVLVLDRISDFVAARALEDEADDAIGSELEYVDASALRVTVRPAGGSDDPCKLLRCTERPADVRGGTLLVGESETGTVAVLRLSDQSVAAEELGDAFRTAWLVSVVEHPLLRLRTRAAVIQAGNSLDIWET